MNKEKKQTVYVSYQPMCKNPGQALTHYTCAAGKRGYLTLRRRETNPASKAR